MNYPCPGCLGQLATADLAGDGKIGLVAPAGASGIAVLRGSGNGTLAGAVDYPTTAAARAVAVADFNHDGRPDVAVSVSSRAGGGAAQQR